MKDCRYVCLNVSLYMKEKFIYLFFVFLSIQSAYAQYVDRSIKAYSQICRVRNEIRSVNDKISKKIVLPPIATTKSIDKYIATGNRLKTLEFAKKRSVVINPLHCGEIIRTENGRFFWQMTILSKGAKSIGLHFDRFDLPSGASLFVRGKDQIKGAYTSVNNSRQLQISPVVGDSVVIEYNFPMNCTEASRDSIPISIDEIYHDYLDVFSFMRSHNQGEPFFDYNDQTLEDLVCAPNIINYPNVSNESRGVVMMIVGGTSIGTGSLINNKRNDGTPYILTASHVINDNFANEDNINVVDANCQNTVVFFNFTSPLGDKNIRATEEQSLFGTSLVAYNKDVDMVLLKIEGLVDNGKGEKTIPKEYKPYFNGWNIEKSPKSPYFAIHHPMGTTKRYSQAKDENLNIEDYEVYAGVLFKHFEKKHWMINKWDIGTTAGGSSGSPLFDRQGLIIGALTGGSSYCSAPHNDAYYALKEVWFGDAQGADKKKYLSYWLDPDGTGETYCNGLDGKDSDRIKLLTCISGRNKVKELNAINISPDYNNIGNVYRLKKNDKVLGAFFTFFGTQSLYDNFPNMNISLSKVSENKKGVEMIKQHIPQPKYKAYDRENKKLKYMNRWLAGDTCQVYVPLKSFEVKEDGDYLLQIESNSGLNQLNLLGIDTEIQNNYISKNSSFVTDDNKIMTPALGGKISSWIDLLIDRQDCDGDICNNDICYNVYMDSKEISYYNDGKIYINPTALNTHKFNWRVTVWDVMGSKIIDEKLDECQEYLDIKDRVVVRGVYMVGISVNSKVIYYKIKV